MTDDQLDATVSEAEVEEFYAAEEGRRFGRGVVQAFGRGIGYTLGREFVQGILRALGARR